MNFENVKEETHLEGKETNSAMKIAGLFFFLIMVLEIPLSFVVLVIGDAIPANYNMLASILITQGYLLVCALIYVVVTKQSFVKDFMVRKYKISTFFLSVILLMVASPMASWLNMLSQLFTKNEISNAVFEVTNVLPVGIGVLVIGCLPGFVEETIFRGIIYSAFRKRSVLTAIVISAFTFGVMHMNFNQMLYAIYLGVLFALVLEATGSLLSTMILHMLFNGVNTLYVYILPMLYEFLGRYDEAYANVDMGELMSQTVSKKEILASLFMVTPFAMIGVVLTILLLRLIAKMNGRELTWQSICGDKEEVKMTKPVNIPLVLGCLFCLAIAVGNL